MPGWQSSTTVRQGPFSWIPASVTRPRPDWRRCCRKAAATQFQTSGWSGYPITGDFGDYLAGEGVAAVTVELTDHEEPEFERNLAGVQAILAAVDEIVGAEAATAGAEHVWLDEHNTGLWRYAPGSFVHPLALEVLGDTAYLLDGGRVLALELSQPTEPHLLLSPGDSVETVRVLEPLDLASDGASLLVLDRAGDVYRYDPAARNWTVERYDRPSGSSYDHYFVALSASEDTNYLLETSHEQVLRFKPGQKGAALVQLPQSRDVDLSAIGDSVYVLTRALNAPNGDLYLFANGRRANAFQPNVELCAPAPGTGHRGSGIRAGSRRAPRPGPGSRFRRTARRASV